MKGRALFVAAVLLILVAAGVIYTFFSLPGEPGGDAIVLPGAMGGVTDPPADIVESNSMVVLGIDIDETNVQRVLLTLSRPESYKYDATVKYYYTAGEGGYTVQSWNKPGLCKTTVSAEGAVPGGVIRQTVLTENYIYIWSDSVENFYTGIRGDFTSDTLGHMPTYEEIIQLEPGNVIAAGMDDITGELYIETLNPNTGYLEKWRVSVKSGVLMGYECFSLEDGEETAVYSAAVTSLFFDEINDGIFMLPSGTMPQ